MNNFTSKTMRNSMKQINSSIIQLMYTKILEEGMDKKYTKMLNDSNLKISRPGRLQHFFKTF